MPNSRDFINFIKFQHATFHAVKGCICQCQKRPFTNQYATFYRMKNLYGKSPPIDI